MNIKIISGGQTGVDQAALRAARSTGLPTGGWAPRGWLTEQGPAPWLASYGLGEFPRGGYPERTDANARDSDATIWLGSTRSSGFRSTSKACRQWDRPLLLVVEGATSPGDVVRWLDALNRVLVLNVAGNRESVSPGIGTRAERFLVALFSRLPNTSLNC